MDGLITVHYGRHGGIGRIGDVVPTASEEVYDVTDATAASVAKNVIFYKPIRLGMISTYRV